MLPPPPGLAYRRKLLPLVRTFWAALLSPADVAALPGEAFSSPTMAASPASSSLA